MTPRVDPAPAPARVTDSVAPDGTDDAPSLAWWRSPRALHAGLVVLLVLPLLIGLVALHRPRWFPILDMAMTELRVRDVGGRHTPLIGLPGRIGVFGAERGSHPGPLSFWLLAPTYRLFGASAWAMEVGAVVLHTVATALALWFARRRGGVALMLAVAVSLALLLRVYGADVLTQPWNPYMPVTWWFVVLLAVWSVLCGDLVGLPVAVFAASFCAQTHLPYAPITGGMAAVAVVGLVLVARDSERRPAVLRWLGGSVGLAAVLWSPVLVDQVHTKPGNLTLIARHFEHPPEAPVGIVQGVQMVLLHLDPWRFLTGLGTDTGSLSGASTTPAGSYLPGLLVLVLWAAAAVGAWRLRHQVLIRLHAVVGAGLLLAGYSISRIFGLLWYYLMLWAWGITALALVAIGWTGYEVVRRRLTTDHDDDATPELPASLARLRVPAASMAVGAIVVSTFVFGVSAAHVEQPAPELSQEMSVLTPQTVAALRSDGPHEGLNQRYLVTWEDAVNIGAEGVALVNELDREGFDVGVVKPWSVVAARHRFRPTAEATAGVHLASGTEKVAEWRARPDAVEIAHVDLRTPAQTRAFERIRRSVKAELRGRGLDDVATLVDDNLFLAAIDEGGVLNEREHRAIDRLLELGQPSAVFVGGPTMSDQSR